VRRLHTHAFYLYGVIVGLAVREALIRVGPDLFLFLSPTTAGWRIRFAFLRLCIFFLAITTFYFGAGVFFDKVHTSKGCREKYPKANYGLDFWFGLIHFVFFFAWAQTINDYTRSSKGDLSLFLIFLSVIFLYDLAWLLANLTNDSFREIQVWAELCAFVWFIGVFAFVFCKFVLGTNGVFAEEVSFGIFIIYLFLDLTELFTGRHIFSNLLLRLIPIKTTPRTNDFESDKSGFGSISDNADEPTT
jgi:hypothetical protein